MAKKIKLIEKTPSEPVSLLADRLISSTLDLMSLAKTEEDLRINFEKVLDPIKQNLDLVYKPQYEKSIYKSGRSDAIHGQVIIEYEAPNAFQSKKAVDHAFDQLIGYIEGEAKKQALFLTDPRFIGVGFDGSQIFFVHYKGDKIKVKTDLDKQDFIKRGPYQFDNQSARTLLTHLRSLSRQLLNAENLAEVFGPKSRLAPKIVSAFADALENWGNQVRIRTFFNEWKRLFGIVYGEQFNSSQQKEVEALAKLYQVGKDTDFQELLFSVHTYFALLMKLIAAELLTLRDTNFTSSYSADLAHMSEDKFKHELLDIEEGGLYAKKGITNFLEGDFFRWYLEALDSPALKEAIKELASNLAEFDPATTVIDPNVSRDLLKKLYQYLVPQEVRHKLGEYYTPDWLAELLLNQAGYKGDTKKRFLDPACGSGTFLVLAINRAKQLGIEQKLPPLEIAKRIVANIWGFDLNPLAVIAARTNYLFALGELATELSQFEIPIYLTDSVLTPTRTTGTLFGGEALEVTTSVGRFQIPVEWVRDKGFLLGRAAPIIEEMAKQGHSINDATSRFEKEGFIFPTNKELIKNFYKQILELEKQNKDGIWARFLKNVFAPMVAGQFDFVIGNPPWIRWGYLSQDYRKATLGMWKRYGLFSLKGHAARLGGGEKDFSMLFTYASADYYLKDGGELAFLITQEVFKSKGAGEGFRKFRIGENGAPLKVIEAHDMVQVKPFEAAANKTAAIIIRKGEETIYPVPYFVWTRNPGVGKIPSDILLGDALKLLQKKKLQAKPISKKIGSWQTLSSGQPTNAIIQGPNFYQARQGADPQPYGVFLLEVKEKLSDQYLLVSNLSDAGKFKISHIESKIESDLVFPALRGSDIDRWSASPKIFILMTQDPQKREPYSETLMKNNWPQTFSYLLNFKEVLLSRASKSIRDLMNKTNFYSMFGIGTYTMSPYKVVWKLMSNDIVAAVTSQFKTIFGFKMVIPTKTVGMFPINNELEAYYLCGIMNSQRVRDFIKSFSSAGRGFGTPSVMEQVGIPKFDPKKELHQKLAEISKKCHQFKAEGKEKGITELEIQNDKLVEKLFKTKN